MNLTIETVVKGLKQDNKIPLIISGPCSAENEDQLIETCKALAKTGKIHVLRAGIWKPRTKPGSFEGVGSVGLKWLQKAKEITGLKTTVEVANTAHVYEALKHEVDMLWIGSRTSGNPFSVQEIADSLRGVDTTVLVKNPVNPDVALWEGAIERIYKAGITKIGGIHRGFSKYRESKYRNVPQWQIPIELKRRIPELFMICDPSHICGNRELLSEIAQQALDLNFKGLMIESHINPSMALSDAKQQLTPENLEVMLNNLIVRKEKSSCKKVIDELEQLRDTINVIDEELLDLLSQRMKISDQIGKHKKRNKITILQSSRWEEILNKGIETGNQKELNKEFIVKYLTLVHQESINRQNKIINPIRS